MVLEIQFIANKLRFRDICETKTTFQLAWSSQIKRLMKIRAALCLLRCH
jgi:hypothetical protein